MVVILKRFNWSQVLYFVKIVPQFVQNKLKNALLRFGFINIDGDGDDW